MSHEPPDDSGPEGPETPLLPDPSADPSSAGGDAALPSRMERRAADHARRRRRRKKIAFISLASLVGLLVLVAAAGAAVLWYENGRIHRVDVKHLSTVRTTGSQKDVENILLIGSTTRCGLKQQNQAFGLCDEGVTGVNSDVVMILHLDPDHHRASILSIPRDTFVPNAAAPGREQDRCRPGGSRRTQPAHRRHHRRLRYSHPALRPAQLRRLPGCRPGPGWAQDVLSDAGLRRRFVALRTEHRLYHPERIPGPRRGAGPASAVPTAR